MPQCENCQAEILADAQFCEACGHKIGTPVVKQEKAPKKGATEQLTTAPGSLRGEIPFLSGAVDQAKVRLENWKSKGDQAKREAERQADYKRQEQEVEEKKRSGRGAGILNFLVGVLALMAFVYLLVRLPRKNSSPHLALQFWQALTSL